MSQQQVNTGIKAIGEALDAGERFSPEVCGLLRKAETAFRRSSGGGSSGNAAA